MAILVGTGIAPHDGGTNEAIMAFNTVTNAYYVVLFTDGQNLNAFGVNDMKDLPAPLKRWVIDKGGKSMKRIDRRMNFRGLLLGLVSTLAAPWQT